MPKWKKLLKLRYNVACMYTKVKVKKTKGFPKGNKFGKGSQPKVLQMKAREFVLQCINGEDGMRLLLAKIFAQAKRGSYKHQEMLLNYILGKPADNIKIDAAYGKSMLSSPAVVKVIADSIRLDRLAKDVENAPVVTEERIKDMEDVLNKEMEKPNESK